MSLYEFVVTGISRNLLGKKREQADERRLEEIIPGRDVMFERGDKERAHSV